MGISEKRNKKNNRNNVVKNEFYYEYKKRSLIKKSAFCTLAMATAGTYWYVKEVPIKAEMIINNNIVEWKPEKRNLKGLTYHIFKDGEIIDKTNGLKYVDKEQKDTGIPNDIDEINAFRSVKEVKILWKTPIDTSSNNTYQVFAVNRFGRKVFKSEETTGGLVSGIDKYVVKFKGKEFETKTPEFIIKSDDITKGTHTIDIKSIDKSGNESEYKTFAFDYDVVEFKFEDNKVIPKNPSYTNELYNFYMLDEQSIEKQADIPQYDKKMFLVNEDILNFLDNESTPIMTTPTYTVKNKELSISWSKPKANEIKKSFYVEVVEKNTYNKQYSDLIEVKTSNDTFGYHYAINNSSTYTVKPTDIYTSDLNLFKNISEFDKEKKYYFHIASISNSGTLSKTKTVKLDLNVISELEQKKNIARKFVFKTKNSTNDEYRKVVDLISNNLSQDSLKKLSEKGVKIYLIKEDFKDYLEENYQLKTTSNVCYKSKNLIFVNTNEKYSELLSDTLNALL